jgi:hypothetical protein
VSSRRRRGRLALAAALAVLTALVAVATWVWLQLPEEPRFETDSRLMEQTTAQLREVEVELGDLPLPLGATDEGTNQLGCRTDSGDVFQPAAVRHWRVRPSEGGPIAQAVAEAMLARAWTGSGGPDQFGSYYLSAERRTWAASAVVYNSFDGELVYVEVTIKDAQPCRLAE